MTTSKKSESALVKFWEAWPILPYAESIGVSTFDISYLVISFKINLCQMLRPQELFLICGKLNQWKNINRKNGRELLKNKKGGPEDVSYNRDCSHNSSNKKRL